MPAPQYCKGVILVNYHCYGWAHSYTWTVLSIGWVGRERDRGPRAQEALSLLHSPQHPWLLAWRIRVQSVTNDCSTDVPHGVADTTNRFASKSAHSIRARFKAFKLHGFWNHPHLTVLLNKLRGVLTNEWEAIYFCNFYSFLCTMNTTSVARTTKRESSDDM